MKTLTPLLRWSASQSAIVLAAGVWLPGLFSAAVAAPLQLSIQLAPQVVLQWLSQTNATYRLEFSSSLNPANWQTLADNLQGTGVTLSFTNGATSSATRYYRLVQSASASISPDAVVPVPGTLYPGNTLLGVAPLGLQFRIPAAWKGGIAVGSSTSVFGSDTEPGVVLGILTLAGDANFILRILPSQFQTSAGSGFSVTQPFAANGNLITGEWTGYGDRNGIIMRLEAVVHPSGGIVGFAGLFTAPNRSSMEQTLGSFINSTLTVPRLTDQQWVSGLKGRAFQWTSYKSVGSGGNTGSLSSWSENNAFFCDGSYEITRNGETTYGGNLSGGGFYSGGGSQSSTEAGDWTVLQTPAGSVLVLLSSKGLDAEPVTLGPSGNTFYFGDQEYTLTGAANCVLP